MGTKKHSLQTPSSILEAFEAIVEAAENSNLSDEFFSKNSAVISYAAGRLGLEPTQAVFLALFVDRSEDRSIYLSRIADYLGCRTTRILRLSAAIDALEEKRYLRATHGRNSLCYRVPADVVKALRQDEPYRYRKEPVSDLTGFFDKFRKLMAEKDDDELTYDSLLSLTKEMMDEIPASSLTRGLRACKLDSDYTMLFVFMAHLFVENSDDNICFSDLENLYDNDEVPSWCKRELRGRRSMLITKKLIENTNEDGMARSDSFKLTERAKAELLADLNLRQMAGRSEKGLIQYESLPEKKMYYSGEEKAQIAQLTSILSERRLRQVQGRLRKAGMRSGFCCLFYGAPGTGKTETVYQIARKTKRNIMQVDVDKIKSCWVGESEKNIKALFDRYRAICKDSKNTPILLFNEADAILGVRMEGASHAVDKMENSIQNIILQEMESLEGIMIATTNLTSNLDKAFERRFLYKVRYERPSAEQRAGIWKSMIPGLRKKDALTLAAGFDLSGGEIENIARKHTVQAILSGTSRLDVKSISEICKTERLRKPAPNSVGFIA